MFTFFFNVYPWLQHILMELYLHKCIMWIQMWSSLNAEQKCDKRACRIAYVEIQLKGQTHGPSVTFLSCYHCVIELYEYRGIQAACLLSKTERCLATLRWVAEKLQGSGHPWWLWITAAVCNRSYVSSSPRYEDRCSILKFDPGGATASFLYPFLSFVMVYFRFHLTHKFWSTIL